MDQPLALLLEARDAAHGGRARRLRQAAGVSQSEVAGTIGVDPSCISRWEAGRRRPGGEEAVRWALALRELAAYLGSPTNALAEGEAPKDDGGPAHEPSLVTTSPGDDGRHVRG